MIFVFAHVDDLSSRMENSSNSQLCTFSRFRIQFHNFSIFESQVRLFKNKVHVFSVDVLCSD